MTVFQYDSTFEGLLTALFDAYYRRTFPDLLLAEKEPLPLFHEEVHQGGNRCGKDRTGLETVIT